jgi:hypothetical protein
MVEVVETVRVVNSGILPEGLAEYEAFGRNEQGRLVGFSDGEAKVIQGVGDLLVKTLVEVGAAEEVVIEEESSQIQALKERVHELEDQLAAERTGHAAEIEKLQAGFREQLEARDQQISDLAQKVNLLTAQLEERGLMIRYLNR